MGSNALRCVSVGSARRSKVTTVPGTWQVLRVSVAEVVEQPLEGSELQAVAAFAEAVVERTAGSTGSTRSGGASP